MRYRAESRYKDRFFSGQKFLWGNRQRRELSSLTGCRLGLELRFEDKLI
jgi:hypothetical protein